MLYIIPFALLALPLLITNVGVLSAKTSINKWIEELLTKGRITSGDVSDLATAFSPAYLANLTLNIERYNKIQILRNKKIRHKIREMRSLARIRNYLIAGLALYIIVLWIIFGAN